MRQIVLDTETTGLEPDLGHRIIEIGCVELVNRRPTGRTFHHYLNPERDIDEGALAVHGISREELQGKPRFADVAEELLAFISGAELVIHNAAFDVAFLDAELKRHADRSRAARTIGVAVPRARYARARARDASRPAQQPRRAVQALRIDNSHRELHGALLDARILADVYLAMTGGQVGLALGRAAARRASPRQRPGARAGAARRAAGA